MSPSADIRKMVSVGMSPGKMVSVVMNPSTDTRKMVSVVCHEEERAGVHISRGWSDTPPPRSAPAANHHLILIVIIDGLLN